MAGATITFRVEEAERAELAARAARDKVNLSDYIRVRLGLRAQGSQGDDDVQMEPGDQPALRQQLADHESRLLALEARDLDPRRPPSEGGPFADPTP